MAEGWKVTAQRKVDAIAPGGGIHKVWEIHYKTDHGVTGQVTVPEAQYNADFVREAIQKEVDTIAEIHAL